MYRYIFILIPLLCACKPNAETAQENSGLSIEKKTISRTIHDEVSPLGFWEIKIEYPALQSDAATAKAINAAISQTATEFQCDESKGDKQFDSEVTLLNQKLLSLKFSDSWYCAGMPDTKGRTGALTYNLSTGKSIFIDNEIKKSFQKEFDQEVNSGLTQALKVKQVDGCPTPEPGYFYLTETEFVFVNKSDTDESVQCEVEFKIANSKMKKYLKDDSSFL